MYDDQRFDSRAGWRYRCDVCGWQSPVMKYRAGAERHEDEHREAHRPSEAQEAS
jgi:hypothetical protein